MMMETAIYTREFLFVRELRDSGKLGRIQFMRGSHQQEMAGWPGYWEGLPPMHYATHAVSPCLALVRGEAEYVSCFGSGRIEDRLVAKYGSPFAVETRPVQGARPATGVRSDPFAVRDGAPVSRELRRLWRQDGVRVEPDRERAAGDSRRREAGARRRCRITRGCCRSRSSASRRRASTTRRTRTCPSFRAAATADRTRTWCTSSYPASSKAAPSFPDVYQSVNWTCAGICAHESAMQDGRKIALPDFRTEIAAGAH